MSKKSITEFLSNEYKGFAFYVIENRALPSVIDGFKPTQRKITHGSTMIWKTGTEKSLKVFQLSGFIANKCFYHHGSTSLENGIITMAQKFKNNAPLLEEVGQYGSLRSPQAGAPRYIGTKLSKNFRLLYKDFELLVNKEEEGEVIEPNFFLPIIPTVLLNGSSGIAVGFSSNILNRNPNDLIDACAYLLKGREISTIKPYVKDFKGEFINDPENPKRWIIRGKLDIKNTRKILDYIFLNKIQKYDNYKNNKMLSPLLNLVQTYYEHNISDFHNDEILQDIREIKIVLTNLYQDYKKLGYVPYYGVEEEIQKYSHREMARKFAELLDK